MLRTFRFSDSGKDSYLLIWPDTKILWDFGKEVGVGVQVRDRSSSMERGGGREGGRGGRGREGGGEREGGGGEGGGGVRKKVPIAFFGISWQVARRGGRC